MYKAFLAFLGSLAAACGTSGNPPSPPRPQPSAVPTAIAAPAGNRPYLFGCSQAGCVVVDNGVDAKGHVYRLTPEGASWTRSAETALIDPVNRVLCDGATCLALSNQELVVLDKEAVAARHVSFVYAAVAPFDGNWLVASRALSHGARGFQLSLYDSMFARLESLPLLQSYRLVNYGAETLCPPVPLAVSPLGGSSATSLSGVNMVAVAFKADGSRVIAEARLLVYALDRSLTPPAWIPASDLLLEERYLPGVDITTGCDQLFEKRPFGLGAAYPFGAGGLFSWEVVMSSYTGTEVRVLAVPDGNWSMLATVLGKERKPAPYAVDTSLIPFPGHNAILVLVPGRGNIGLRYALWEANRALTPRLTESGVKNTVWAVGTRREDEIFGLAGIPPTGQPDVRTVTTFTLQPF